MLLIMRRLLPLLAVGALAYAAAAGASPQRQVHLGLAGDPGRFASVSGQTTEVRHVFVNFRQRRALSGLVARNGPVPMLALIPGAYGQKVTATPEGIAKGQNDTFLFRLNAAIAAYDGSLFYLRPFPEMNGHWESNCAYNSDGSLRPAYDSTAWSRKAFARVAIITRGGTADEINAKLARLHLPRINRDLPVTTPKLQLVWNPQGFGSPDLPGNSANAYYPGDAYVDVVADDLYDIAGHGATWAAAEALYASHPTKQFAFGEWGLWGIDDPAFVRAMGTFARTHRRVVMLAYLQREARLDLRPPQQAEFRGGVPQVHLAARLDHSARWRTVCDDHAMRKAVAGVFLVVALVGAAWGGTSSSGETAKRPYHGSYDGSGDTATIRIASGTPKVGRSTSPGALSGAAAVAKLLKGIPQKRFVLGYASAPVTLIEYIDLQCPVCRQFEATELAPLVKKYVRTGKLKIRLQPWQILDYSGGHDSTRGQKATIAAAVQNKAFNFAQVLYDNQGIEETGWMNDEMISKIAASVDHLKPYTLAHDANSAATRKVIKSITTWANSHPKEMTGTPTIYLAKGSAAPKFYFTGVPSLTALEAAIDARLK